MRIIPALVFYALVWGLVVETVDRLGGDPFDPLDALTHAGWTALAIALWPVFRRVWGTRAAA